jgi:hypothetical protein
MSVHFTWPGSTLISDSLCVTVCGSGCRTRTLRRQDSGSGGGACCCCSCKGAKVQMCKSKLHNTTHAVTSFNMQSRRSNSKLLRREGGGTERSAVKSSGKIKAAKKPCPLVFKRVQADPATPKRSSSLPRADSPLNAPVSPRRSSRLRAKEDKLKVSLLLDWIASQPFDVSESEIEEIFEENGIAMTPTNPALDGIEEVPSLFLPPAKIQSICQFFRFPNSMLQ